MVNISKIHRTVVRNQPYQKSGISIRERHNERKNIDYMNPDIEPSRIPLNVYYKHCEGSYIHALDTMIESGAVSTRGLKEDAKLFGELVFDVNTVYFEENGGYEYATRFFEEAYRFAQKEVGADFILSAVMHADERNRTLSEELGKDVYHYHLHVIYIPVVEKEIKWSKRCKDKALVGKTKEIIHQISHSKKWAFMPLVNESGQPICGNDGKQKRVTSYSLLQDGFHTHMKDAGYAGFERGERGSTAEHLSVIDFKVQQDTQRLGEIEKQIGSRQDTLTTLENKLVLTEKAQTDYHQIDNMGKETLSGKMALTPKEYADITTLAKEGILSRRKIDDLKRDLNKVVRQFNLLRIDYKNLYDNTRLFVEAMKIAPQKITDFLNDILTKAKEEQIKTREAQLRAREEQRRKRQQQQPQRGRHRDDGRGR